MIDYRVKTFLTLCNFMNYRKTAQVLNMTQPAVTQHIHFLENQYGCKLFDYDRHSLKMTREGMLLKRYCESVMYQEEKLFEKIKSGEKRLVRFGATKTIGEYVIPEQVERFLQLPDYNVEIEIDNTRYLLDKLKRGELDFALIEGFFDSNDFLSRVYRSENFVGVCSKNHRFANKTILPDDIFTEHLFLREKGSGTRNILEQVLSEHNRTTEHFARVTCINHFTLMSELIADNLGITFAYEVMQKSYSSLAPFYVKGWNIVRDFNYVYLDSADSLEILETFDNLSE
ncbi:LysR family transcriptional regulator [Ruminococcus sp. AF43-11]|nr:LysR family transcriptional regulator [Ruminococcus sp. AF43-11]RGF35841.1 LysR family transcriptional regulator [Ruminococcus sp. AF43-11]